MYVYVYICIHTYIYIYIYIHNFFLCPVPAPRSTMKGTLRCTSNFGTLSVRLKSRWGCRWWYMCVKYIYVYVYMYVCVLCLCGTKVYLRREGLKTQRVLRRGKFWGREVSRKGGYFQEGRVRNADGGGFEIRLAGEVVNRTGGSAMFMTAEAITPATVMGGREGGRKGEQ
jgi:hypothetical protein